MTMIRNKNILSMTMIRNKNILNHIASYCLRIENSCQRFGDSLEALVADFDYKSTVAMYVLQIG